MSTPHRPRMLFHELFSPISCLVPGKSQTNWDYRDLRLYSLITKSLYIVHSTSYVCCTVYDTWTIGTTSVIEVRRMDLRCTLIPHVEMGKAVLYIYIDENVLAVIVRRGKHLKVSTADGFEVFYACMPAKTYSLMEYLKIVRA